MPCSDCTVSVKELNKQNNCKKCASYSDGDNADIDRNCKMLRRPDGSIKLRNPNIDLMDQDILYHLALGSGSHDLAAMFGDVKFICMGGTPNRMEQFAYYILEQIGPKLPVGTTLLDITKLSHRFAMYKVGPVLSISHGMGVPSISILLHEIIKLMYHAKAKDPVIIRIGTSGGIGVEPGTVVVSDGAVNTSIQEIYEQSILGKPVTRLAKLDKKLANEIKSLANPENDYLTITGKTMCTDDFYEGQGRLDGAICEYTEQDKMNFLTGLQKGGVVNIEMEACAFAALTHHAGIRSAIVCATLVDRMKGDQVYHPKEMLLDWATRPQELVGRYIKKQLMQDPVKAPRKFRHISQGSENSD